MRDKDDKEGRVAVDEGCGGRRISGGRGSDTKLHWSGRAHLQLAELDVWKNARVPSRTPTCLRGP